MTTPAVWSAVDGVGAMLRSHALARAREEEDRVRDEALALRADARAEARCRDAALRLSEADARLRSRRDALRRRIEPPGLPVPVDRPREAAPLPETGWEDDPVAMEAIGLVSGATLDDAGAVSSTRKAVGKLLHPDRGGDHEGLLGWANDFLDRALERVRMMPAAGAGRGAPG